MTAGDVSVEIATLNAKTCAIFDGVDDEVTLSTTDPLLLEGNDCSVSLWFLQRSMSGANKQILSNSFGTKRFNINAGNTGRLVCSSWDGSHVAKASSTGFITYNKWTHIVYTHTAANVGTLYVDGVLQTGTANAVTSGTDGFKIGALSSGANFWNGSIRDVRTYHKVLSAQQAIDLFNGVDVTDEIFGRWKLEEDYTDSVGSNDGTNTGTRFGIVDDKLGNIITSNYISANDKWMLTSEKNGKQLTLIHTEEA